MSDEGTEKFGGSSTGFGYLEIVVPRPTDIKMIIVAESPSSTLIPIYMASRTFDDESARRMIFAAAEPGRLLVRVQHFLREIGDAQEEEKLTQLFKLFHCAHLVYLNRAPADERSELQPMGLDAVRKEVDELLDEGVQAIVALGDSAQNWVRTNYPPEGLMLIYLPGPSNHISSWFPSFLERMSRERGTDTLALRDSMAVQIDKLVRVCAEL